MSYPLAVFTYQLGTFSETFVRRHIERLLPGRTVVATAIEADQYGGHWTVDCPTLIVNKTQRRRLREDIKIAALKTLGFNRLNHGKRPDVAAVQRFLVNYGVRVVLGEYLNEWVEWVPYLKSFGVKFFVHAHGNDVSHCLRDPYWRKEYLKYNEVAGVITMSKCTQNRLIDIGIDPRQIHVIPYGVDLYPMCSPPSMYFRRPNDWQEGANFAFGCVSTCCARYT